MNSLIKIELLNYGKRDEGGTLPDMPPLDITSYCDIRDGVEISQNRYGIDGVFLDVSVPTTFYELAHTIIKNLFYEHGMYAYGQLRILRRNEEDYTTFTERGTFDLDFSDIEITDVSTTIGTVKQNIRSLVESKSNVNFDLQLKNDLIELQYDRLNLRFHKELQLFTNADNFFQSTSSNPTNAVVYPQVSISTNKTDLSINGIYYVPVSETSYAYGGSRRTDPDGNSLDNSDAKQYISFFSNQTGVDLSIDIDYDFSTLFDVQYKGASTVTDRRGGGGVKLQFIVFSGENDFTPYDLQNGILSENESRFLGKDTIIVKSKQQLGIRYIAELNGYQTGDEIKYVSRISNFAKFDLSFITKASNEPAKIYGKFIEDILDDLINAITSSNGLYKATINWNYDVEGESTRKLLLAGEDIRGFNDPYYHISYNNIEKFLYCLGYVPKYVSDYEMVFEYYLNLFNGELQVDLSNNYVNNVRVQGDIDNVFTGFKVGYNKQSYNSENGRYNVNSTFDYSTGLILNEERIHEIISPLRSDQIGLEILLFDRDKDYDQTTDTQSDKNVFVFSVYPQDIEDENNSVYLLDKSNYYTFPSEPDLGLILYDAVFSPQTFADRWINYFAISSRLMRFTATDGYAEARNNTNNLYQDIRAGANDKLMHPATINLETAYIDELYNPETYTGKISLIYKTDNYTGYLKSSMRNFSTEETSTLELYMIGGNGEDWNVTPPTNPNFYWDSGAVGFDIDGGDYSNRLILRKGYTYNSSLPNYGLTPSTVVVNNVLASSNGLETRYIFNFTVPSGNVDITVSIPIFRSDTMVLVGTAQFRLIAGATYEIKEIPIGWNGLGLRSYNAFVPWGINSWAVNFYNNYNEIILGDNLTRSPIYEDAHGNTYAVITAHFSYNEEENNRLLTFELTCNNLIYLIQLTQYGRLPDEAIKQIGWTADGGIIDIRIDVNSASRNHSEIFYVNDSPIWILSGGLAATDPETDQYGNRFIVVSANYGANIGSDARQFNYTITIGNRIFTMTVVQTGFIVQLPIGWYTDGLNNNNGYAGHQNYYITANGYETVTYANYFFTNGYPLFINQATITGNNIISYDISNEQVWNDGISYYVDFTIYLKKNESNVNQVSSIQFKLNNNIFGIIINQLIDSNITKKPLGWEITEIPVESGYKLVDYSTEFISIRVPWNARSPHISYRFYSNDYTLFAAEYGTIAPPASDPFDALTSVGPKIPEGISNYQYVNNTWGDNDNYYSDRVITFTYSCNEQRFYFIITQLRRPFA